MSDLYLVLRRRLEGVPEWVYIDAALLKTAREERGLSYETMARQIPVASKTWERYEKAGRVPRAVLRKVAEILNLEIEEPEMRRVKIEYDEGERETLRAIARLDRKIDTVISTRLNSIESQLRELARQREPI